MWGRTIGIFFLFLTIALGPSLLKAQDTGLPNPALPLLLEEEKTDVEKSGTPLALDEVLEMARSENPEIQASRRKWEAERAKIWAVKSWPDPELGVEFWGRNETWYDVSQKVPFPGKLRLMGKAQEYGARRDQALYLAKEREILQRVKAAYYSYFLVVRQIEIFQESVDLLKRFSRVAENKYSVNRAGQLDVLKAQTEYFKSLNELVTLRQERQTIEAELNSLLNRKPGTPLGKPLEPGLAPFDIGYDELAKKAIEKRPEIFAARRRVDQEKTMLSSAWFDFLPDVNFQYTRREFDNAMKDDNIFMVKFNVPAWFWKQGSRVDAARKTLEEARRELASQEITTYYDVKSLLVKTQTARRLVDLYRTSVIPQAETSLKVATAGYEAGSSNFLDLLDSQRTWLEFQMEYFQYLAQYWTYLASLERVVGEDLVPFEGK